MAPTKKSRGVNKRLSGLNEVSPEKDGFNSNKNKQRKKKLSDKLGSQWSKEELERFYEAYRKYGKDWKKVASVVRNRSIEMVEALYNVNRAYLSLPEGTASVVGLIAMMTDHYNVLEGSDSERESNDALGSQKLLKRKRGKVQLGVSKGSVQSQSAGSDDGCLVTLLKRRRFDGTQPRAVGKRTPRVPISSCWKDNRENYFSPNRRRLKSEVVAALALTEAAQRGGSPQVSQTPFRGAEQKSSPVKSSEKVHQLSEKAHAKFCNASVDEEWLEGSLESRGAENGEYARDTSSLMDMEGVGTVEVHQKGKKIYRKKERVENVGRHQVDDSGEACSGTEEGLMSSSLREKVDIEVTNEKCEQFSLKGERQSSKKLFFGDESSALDALQTLADISLMMPASTMESESSVQLKEGRTIVDKEDKSSLPEAEATSTSQSGDKIKLSGPKQRVRPVIPGGEALTPRKSKLGREISNDANTLPESKEKPPSADRSGRRKRKPAVSKMSNAKLDSHPSGPLRNGAVVEEENKPVIKGRDSGETSTMPKQLKSVRSSEVPLCSEKKTLTASTAEGPLASEGSLPTKQRSRRKMSLQKMFMPKERSDNILKSQPDKYSTSLQDIYLKEKLSGCLLSCMVRRWCIFEWFYSAIDYPWFAKREFMEYLNHVGLGNIPRLTRVEWSVIKSSLGKPRRFSKHFLSEERQKLEQYRESVRKHYTELRTGVKDGLPTDLARPLSVGQRVIAIHPKTREVHDGSVLTVDRDRCRVQFDRPELGVEFVMDIDCMPLNPLDNMPEALRRQNGAGKISFMSEESQMNGKSNYSGCVSCPSSLPLDKASTPSTTLVKQGKGDVNGAIAQTKAATINNICTQPCTVTHHQAREADIRAPCDLTHALDEKEALLMELKSANIDILDNQNDIHSLKDSESFKKHYAAVSSALLHSRQHNTYSGNSLPPWMKISVHDGLPTALDGSLSQDLGSTVIEIVRGSKTRAQSMVDAAIQALSSTKEGEDAFMRIGQALDSIDYQHLASNSRLPVFRSQELVNGSFDPHESICCAPAPLCSNMSGPNLCNESENVDARIPSDLITSCVATLIMIQTCTERQCPPADVAQIIDSALSSLHPRCPQNLPIYREIQMCMGRIKTQILALIPT